MGKENVFLNYDESKSVFNLNYLRKEKFSLQKERKRKPLHFFSGINCLTRKQQGKLLNLLPYLHLYQNIDVSPLCRYVSNYDVSMLVKPKVMVHIDI